MEKLNTISMDSKVEWEIKRPVYTDTNKYIQLKVSWDDERWVFNRLVNVSKENLQFLLDELNKEDEK